MDSSFEEAPQDRGIASPPKIENSLDPTGRIGLLTERQRSYLRLVQQNHNSKEIAALVGASYRAVDKQLMKASGVLGASSRFEAARMLAKHETGVGSSTPANGLPSAVPTLPLPSPLPTAGAAVNMLTWKQVALWTTIIAIVTPIGLTVAGMVIVTLALLLGLKAP